MRYEDEDHEEEEEVECSECGGSFPEDELDMDGEYPDCANQERCSSCSERTEDIYDGQCLECREADAHENYKPVLKMVGRAFDKLEAEHGFVTDTEECCTTCGSYACHLKMEAKNGDAKGAAYYHEQNVQSLMDEGSMCIGFCGVGELEEDGLAAGKLVKQVMESCGLIVKWEESPYKKLEVTF
jgi:hypothetical protein